MSSSTDRTVPVGRIGRPHGVKGEVTVLPDTDDPQRFAVGASFTIGDDRSLTIRSVSTYRDRGLIVGFEGVTDRNAAERLRGSILSVPIAERRTLEDDEFWPEDLVGLPAVDPAGNALGTVSGIEFGSAHDWVVVTTPAGVDVLVPFVSAIVGEVAGGQIVIDAPEDLFPL